jgi:uncharacterized protein (TIGR02246 family)
MSETERNRELTRRFFEALSRNDTEAIVNAYADDGVVETMGNTLVSGVYTKDQIKQVAGMVLSAFPKGLRFIVHHITADGDHVAVEAESQGVHVSGKPYNNKYHFLIVFRDGLIVRYKEYMDTEHCTDVLCGGQRRT